MQKLMFIAAKTQERREYMDIKKFFNEVFGELNVFEDLKGEPYFFGNEVAEKLGYTRARKAILDHVDPEDKKSLKKADCSKTELSKFGDILWANPRDRKAKVLINEAGLFSLILSSELDTAKEFKFWVTHEVLPSIRRNGGYIAGQEDLEKEEREVIDAQVTELSKKVQFLRKRRRELRKDVAALKEKAKRAKKENKALSEYCDTFERMFDQLQKDYMELLAREKKVEKPNPEEKRGFRVVTDQFGNVLQITSEVR